MSDCTTVRLTLISNDYEKLKELRQDLMAELEPDNEQEKSEGGVDLIELEFYEVAEAKLGCDVNYLHTLIGMKVPYSMEWDATNYIQAGEAHYRDSSCDGHSGSVDQLTVQYIESDYIKLSNVIKTIADAKEQGNEQFNETVNLLIRNHLPLSWLSQINHDRNYSFVYDDKSDA